MCNRQTSLIIIRISLTIRLLDCTYKVFFLICITSLLGNYKTFRNSKTKKKNILKNFTSESMNSIYLSNKVLSLEKNNLIFVN